jgi:cell division protein FtsI (penicillin-binding protein 3)
MIRKPLRPLARILLARAKGENPDLIERENIRLRAEDTRARAQNRAEGRLLLLGVAFFTAFTVVGIRMGALSASVPEEPRSAANGAEISGRRADITDRNGRILATNFSTFSLYAQPKQMVDPKHVATELARLFPDMSAEDMERRFTDGRTFMWLRKKLSPEQMQAVHDIGDPGLLFGPRDMRLYPNGRLAAHVLGGASFGAEGVHSAEVIGTAGIERAMDSRLRDPAQAATPLALSLDLTVQSTMAEVLDAGMTMMNAKGAAGVLMDVHTGEIISMVSLPDFDPNDRPAPLLKGDPGDSPLFNRSLQGVYELGSTAKIFAAAQALELGLMNADTMIDANSPMRWGKFKIGEFEGHNYGPLLSVTDVIVKSSNVGTAHIALQIGGDRQQAFFKALGLFDPVPIELTEAPGSGPLIPKRWSDIVTITTSYGHGMSVSPMHLAVAYSALANDGVLLPPTLLKRDKIPEGTRIVSAKTAAIAASMLRQVVARGTASLGDVEGYEVGGKTGTADKVRRGGGYDKGKNINTFAAMFPVSDPQYVLVVTLDEASENTGPKPRRTAGWTTVPVAAEVIRRVAPLLGLRPQIEYTPLNAVSAPQQ